VPSWTAVPHVCALFGAADEAGDILSPLPRAFLLTSILQSSYQPYACRATGNILPRRVRCVAALRTQFLPAELRAYSVLSAYAAPHASLFCSFSLPSLPTSGRAMDVSQRYLRVGDNELGLLPFILPPTC